MYRVNRPEERIWDQHDVGSPKNTNSTQSLVSNSANSIAEIARSIGVHEMTLGKWVKKARDDGRNRLDRYDDDERAELERLRKEVVRLRMEAEFAKKWRRMRVMGANCPVLSRR